MSASKRPRLIVLIHGYSDSAKGFAAWRDIIAGWGYETTDVYIGNYVSAASEKAQPALNPWFLSVSRTGPRAVGCVAG